ncbi:MAG: hypothetical protein J6P13_07530 [Kiritimatiellae bacterium]|nr:hypothetical protein [Kiritimatiellia bacterium]
MTHFYSRMERIAGGCAFAALVFAAVFPAFAKPRPDINADPDIAEKYIQCYDGEIQLLPALDKDEAHWGHKEGLKAVGGFVFDMEWSGSTIKKMRVRSTEGGVCRIRLQEGIRSLLLREAAGDCPNAAIAATKNLARRPTTPESCFNRAENPLSGVCFDFDTGKDEVFEFRGASGSKNWPDYAVSLDDELLLSPEGARIAQNVLDYQLDSGAWPKDVQMQQKLTKKEREMVLSFKSDKNRASIDNSATFTEMRFLARMAQITHKRKYLDGVLKGIDFLLGLEYPGGGRMQGGTAKAGNCRETTYSDDAMVDMMKALRDIYEANPPYDIKIPQKKRTACRKAFEKVGSAYPGLAKRVCGDAAPAGRIKEAAVGKAPVPNPVVLRVAKSGGDFDTVQAAFDAIPENPRARHIIKVAPGKYREKVVLGGNRAHVRMIAEDPDPAKTIISWNDTPATLDGRGKPMGTFGCWTMKVTIPDFEMTGFTIENTGTPERLAATNGKEQAGQCVALFVEGDRSVFRKCRILGWQDTLYAGGQVGESAARQYFEECYIEGAVDFIFGGSVALFSHCTLHSVNGGYVTAGSHTEDMPFGYVFYKCKVTAAEGKKTYLGRPWRPFANITFVACDFGDAVTPEGWKDWSTDCGVRVYRSAEYMCTQTGPRKRDSIITIGGMKELKERLSAAGYSKITDLF